MPHNRSGFTLIELIAVVVTLAILAGLALAVYLDYSEKAHRATMMGVIGAVQEGVVGARLAYATDNAAGLPPDTIKETWPNHLGDTAYGEPTLWDAILDPPWIPQSKGWKQWPAFPSVGFYTYFYDKDGDNALDADEAYIRYKPSETKPLVTYLPP